MVLIMGLVALGFLITALLIAYYKFYDYKNYYYNNNNNHNNSYNNYNITHLLMGGGILNWASADGSFKRQASLFRDFISRSSERFKPEKGRYHLYVSYACPWVSIINPMY